MSKMNDQVPKERAIFDSYFLSLLKICFTTFYLTLHQCEITANYLVLKF